MPGRKRPARHETAAPREFTIERLQTGVRMEKRLSKVLEAIAA